MKFILCLLSCWSFGCAGFAAQNRAITQDCNFEELTSILPKQLPKDTDANDALKFLKKEGFSCKFEPQGTFRYQAVNRDGTVSKAVATGEDFIRCNRETRTGLVIECIEVAVFIKAGKVQKIICNREFVGP